VGSAPDAGKIPGVLGMQKVLNGVSMAVGVMEKALCSSYTHPERSDRTSLALAKCICRTSDWLYPTGVSESHDCIGRTAPQANTPELRRLLQ
jgi:hypothetical protein